jgi:antitoxin (DNA-binding transcriptional repressor) of toxin-antitoxin stability system
MQDIPRFFRIRQKFPRPVEQDLRGATERALTAAGLPQRIRAGETVAITAGSRGVANIAQITRHAVDFCRGLGALPFVVPAMGSHGGATAAGQLGVLARYGITPESMGCEVRSSMEVVEVCRATEGFQVYFDRHASLADHVLVVNRVKSHTKFVGPVESGLMKMMLIGLGKQHGALVYHRAIMNYSFDQIVRSVARAVIQRCRIVGGLAILENGYEETAELVGLPPERIESGEPELLKRVQGWAPRLPVDQLEFLMVDAIGKEISGAGMDTNVVGRKYNDHTAMGDERPAIRHIYLRGLTKDTHGNATGMGMAEMCHRRLIEAMDEEVTRMNCMTAGHLTAAMRPVEFKTDREAVRFGIGLAGMLEPPEVPALWIRNTLHLEELECSEVLLPRMRELPHVEVLTEPTPLEFDATGDLIGRFD